MGKLSKNILSALLLSQVQADTNFEVTNCNDQTTLRPALSFRILQSYYENNLSDQTGFELNNGYYEKTIQESELQLAFDEDNDQIQLSHTISIANSGFDQDDDTAISFAGDSIQFQCNYSRAINVQSTFDGPTVPPQPIVGQGTLSYRMDVTVGSLGGTTQVRILPNHEITGIAPRLTECSIVDETNTHTLFPVHSFKDEVCFDNARLNFEQTEFFPAAAFNLKTFRFIVDGADSENEQTQTISCSLHLDPVDSVVQEQANDCTCYNQAECADECSLATDNCSDDATCSDTERSFECSCNDGYSGDGITCDEQFAVWINYDNNGVLDLGYNNQDQDDSFTDVSGHLRQMDIGEFGTFGINDSNMFYYRHGTNEDPYSVGTTWDRLEPGNNWKWVSSDRDTVIVIDQDERVYSFENVSFDASGNIQYDLNQFPGDHLTQISAFRNVAWGLNRNNQVVRQSDMAARRSNAPGWPAWTAIDNPHGITRVEIGDFGVFALAGDKIYYRVGTHRNIDSAGTRWQQLAGGLDHISVGIHNVYGTSLNDHVFKFKPTTTFNDEGELVWEGNYPWIWVTGVEGRDISVL